jgi:hypothetical protein
MNDGTVVPSSVLFHSSFCAPDSTRWRAILMSSQWTSLNSRTRWKALQDHALPGHEAAERDAVLRELQRRLLDAYERAPRPRAPIRLRLVRDERIHCGVRAVLLS